MPHDIADSRTACQESALSDALRICSGAFGRVALLDMDRSLVRHAHPHCHVLIKVDGGDTAFLVGERMAPLTDETAVLVNAWTPHAYVHDPKKPRTLILALYVEPLWLAEFRTNWAASGEGGFFASSVGAITAEIRRRAMALAASMVQDPSASGDHQTLLGGLMVTLIEQFAEWRSVGAGLREAARQNAVDWRIRKAMRVIREAPGEVESIDRIALAAGMSRANFFRVFQASLGVTPRVFLNVIRLEEAVHHAVHSDQSFGRMSDRLGFSSQGHFTRFFRDHAGAAPSQYRSIARLGAA